jgi:hypothetical protein
MWVVNADCQHDPVDSMSASRRSPITDRKPRTTDRATATVLPRRVRCGSTEKPLVPGAAHLESRVGRLLS